MGSGVSDATSLIVHQSLHGYADGHRQLAGSLELSPKDSRIVLGLSDASGAGARPEEGGYLTGYALQETGAYAFARTWNAPEVSRPGCVWTHTLYLDFADLARLTEPRELLPLFRRPSRDAPADYRMPLRVDCKAVAEGLDRKDDIWFASIVAMALYDGDQIPRRGQSHAGRRR